MYNLYIIYPLISSVYRIVFKFDNKICIFFYKINLCFDFKFFRLAIFEIMLGTVVIPDFLVGCIGKRVLKLSFS